MPDYITQIVADGDLSTAMAAFSATCAANSAILGLTPAQVSEIDAAAGEFQVSLNDWYAARNAASSAVAAKDQQKETSRAVISKYAKIFRADLDVPDALLAQLMLPPHSTPGTKTPPVTPTGLYAEANGLGLVELRWDRTGNTPATVFQVQFRTSPTGDWAVLGSTTKTKFVHQWSPGTYVAYRLTALRNGETSAPGTPVALWEPGGEAILQIAA